MFMLGMLKTILKTVLKYEKNTITLYSMCWNWAADFIFLLRFCTRNWSETYIFTHNFMKSLSQYDRFEWVFMSAQAQACDPWLFLVTLQSK